MLLPLVVEAMSKIITDWFGAYLNGNFLYSDIIC